MLERLHAVDWNALTHAYGPAGDVPGLIQAIAAADRQTRKDAYWELYGTIFHQGTRYSATAPAVPFLIELLADPATPDRHDLLLLLTHLVTGQFSVAADPTMYAGVADDTEDTTVLRDVYRAAELGLPLYLGLVQAAETAPMRGAAALLLACMWTHAAEVVPVLHARLAHETSVPARASLAFALGRLQGAPGPDPRLLALHADDPAPLVRLLAAVGVVRGVGMVGVARKLRGENVGEIGGENVAEVPDAVIATLIAAVNDPDGVPGYDELPCGERDVAGDIGHVLRSLPPALGRRALPALCAALRRAEDFGTMGLVEAMLAFTFGEPSEPDVSEDMPEAPAPALLDPTALDDDQRLVLTTMAATHELWTIGNLFFVLRSHGIPTVREQLAELLGLPLVRDEAAELAAQARFHRVHMHDPAEAVTLLRRALELAPADAGLWQQLAHDLHDLDDNAGALVACERALAVDPDCGAAQFVHGLVVVHTDPARAAAAFARAAELAYQPLQARTNQSTCLAMIGRRSEALALLTALSVEHPEFVDGWYSLGLAYIKLGDHGQAIAALDRALGLDPDHGNGHYARACAHALADQAALALADVARAIAIDPGLRAAIRDDADFESLAGTPEFNQLIADPDAAPVLRN